MVTYEGARGPNNINEAQANLTYTTVALIKAI